MHLGLYLSAKLDLGYMVRELTKNNQERGQEFLS